MRLTRWRTRSAFASAEASFEGRSFVASLLWSDAEVLLCPICGGRFVVQLYVSCCIATAWEGIQNKQPNPELLRWRHYYGRPKPLDQPQRHPRLSSTTRHTITQTPASASPPDLLTKLTYTIDTSRHELHSHNTPTSQNTAKMVLEATMIVYVLLMIERGLMVSMIDR